MTFSSPRPAREPIFNLPPATLMLLAAIVGVHIVRSFLSEAADVRWMLDYAFIPLRFWSLFDETYAARELSRLISFPGGVADPTAGYTVALARHLLTEQAGRPVTLVSYAFLHGDWTHAIVNTVWLAAFGSAVEKRIGALRLLVLFVAGAIAGALFHALLDPASLAPLVGASAGVSACFGAAARFVFAAGGPLGLIGVRSEAAFRRPAPPLAETLRDRRSLNFILVWFGLNLVLGWLAEPLGISSSPVAWFAHVGGFLVGLLGFALFDRRRN
jgi:membrane associated rhomboid family serine protease